MAQMSVQMNNVVPLKKGWKRNKEDFYMNNSRKPSIFRQICNKSDSKKTSSKLWGNLKCEWQTSSPVRGLHPTINCQQAGWGCVAASRGERSRRFGGMWTEITAPSIGTFITGESKQILEKIFAPATCEYQKTYWCSHCSSFLYSTTKYHQITWILHTVAATIMTVSVRACVREQSG